MIDRWRWVRLCYAAEVILASRTVSKEFFHYPETAQLFTRLEEAAQRSGVSRGQAFEDFLTMSVCCLSGGRMEDLYLQTVAKHTSGKPGKRGCDSIAHLFGELVAAMEQDTREGIKDILGDLFEGAITYGEHQQYLTPMPVCDMMARLTLGESDSTDTADEPESPAAVESVPTGESDSHDPQERKSVCDPCCGSGRMLLAVAQIHRDWEFTGQDIDLRCVRMTALNLAFRNLYGYVIWGNSLAVENKLVYRTGFDGRGFLREIPLDACPIPVQQKVMETSPRTHPVRVTENPVDEEPPGPTHQLQLF